jgi:hypothetical protein
MHTDVSAVPEDVRELANELEDAIDADDDEAVRSIANKLNELCERLFQASKNERIWPDGE